MQVEAVERHDYSWCPEDVPLFENKLAEKSGKPSGRYIRVSYISAFLKWPRCSVSQTEFRFAWFWKLASNGTQSR